MKENPYAHKPTARSREGLSPVRWYYAFDADGKPKGEVVLTYEKKRQYEAKGFTFKPRKP